MEEWPSMPKMKHCKCIFYIYVHNVNQIHDARISHHMLCYHLKNLSCNGMGPQQDTGSGMWKSVDMEDWGGGKFN
jgi:hypothetical protein